MKNILLALTIIAFQFGFAQKTAKKTVTKENPVLYKETEVLKAISGAVKQLKPDADAKAVTTLLSQVASDCVDVMYYRDNPSDAAFFELLKQQVGYKWSFTTYAVTDNGQTVNIPMKLLIVKFPETTDIAKTSSLLAPCYCLPNVYVVAFQASGGWFVSFEPDLSQFAEAKQRTHYYAFLQKHLRNSLTGFTYQNVSLWNND